MEDDPILTHDARVWNRAALRAGGANPREGDRALADLLVAHGMVMNGGVAHALDVLSAKELSDAAAGFRFFSFDDVAELFAAASESQPANATDAQYWRSIPDDATVTNRFHQVLASSPELFAPL